MIMQTSIVRKNTSSVLCDDDVRLESALFDFCFVRPCPHRVVSLLPRLLVVAGRLHQQRKFHPRAQLGTVPPVVVRAQVVHPKPLRPRALRRTIDRVGRDAARVGSRQQGRPAKKGAPGVAHEVVLRGAQKAKVLRGGLILAANAPTDRHRAGLARSRRQPHRRKKKTGRQWPRASHCSAAAPAPADPPATLRQSPTRPPCGAFLGQNCGSERPSRAGRVGRGRNSPRPKRQRAGETARGSDPYRCPRASGDSSRGPVGGVVAVWLLLLLLRWCTSSAMARIAASTVGASSLLMPSASAQDCCFEWSNSCASDAFHAAVWGKQRCRSRTAGIHLVVRGWCRSFKLTAVKLYLERCNSSATPTPAASLLRWLPSSPDSCTTMVILLLFGVVCAVLLLLGVNRGSQILSFLCSVDPNPATTCSRSAPLL